MNAYSHILRSLTLIILLFAESSQGIALDTLDDWIRSSVWCAQESKPLDSMEDYGSGVSGHRIYGVETCFSLNAGFIFQQFWRRVEAGQSAETQGMIVKVNGNSLDYQLIDNTRDFTYPFPTHNVSGTLIKRGKYLDMTQLGYMKDGALVRYANRFVRVKRFPWLPSSPANNFTLTPNIPQ